MCEQTFDYLPTLLCCQIVRNLPDYCACQKFKFDSHLLFLAPHFLLQDEVADGLRDYACLEDVVPLVAILDLAEGSKFLLEEGVEVSTATVHNFVTRYRL